MNLFLLKYSYTWDKSTRLSAITPDDADVMMSFVLISSAASSHVCFGLSVCLCVFNVSWFVWLTKSFFLQCVELTRLSAEEDGAAGSHGCVKGAKAVALFKIGFLSFFH